MRGKPKLEAKVRRTLIRHSMVRPGEHILVAVSGGADSVALLYCLFDLAREFALRLTVAHLDHGLRGDASRADARFVRELSAGLALPFVSESLDVRAAAAASRRNLEEEARRARYGFLRRAADAAGAARIAVGHTLDDQAETVLFRLLRGSGVTGLSGIRPVLRNKIIRPLLDCTRSEVLDYLRARSATWREDASNEDLTFRRNRIRHELLPYLERHFNRGIRRTLAREASLARQVSGFLEREAGRHYEALRQGRGGVIALPAPALAALDPALALVVLRHAVKEAAGSLRGIDARHWAAILSLCLPGRSGRRLELPGRLKVVREFDDLKFETGGAPDFPGYCYSLPVPGECAVPEAGVRFVARLGGPAPAPEGVVLDGTRLGSELTVRPRREGDRYGGPGHRRVKKMFIDRKIPLSVRDRLPLVVAQQTVVWIPGFEPASGFSAGPAARRPVVIEIHPL